MQIKLDKKIRTIVPCLMNNDVNFCPPWRLKITVEELRIKLGSFRSLRKLQPFLTVIRPQGCRIRRMKGLVSYWPKIRRARRPPIIVFPIVTAYCSRSQEFLRSNGNRIAPITALEKYPTRHLSRMDCEGPWVTRLIL